MTMRAFSIAAPAAFVFLLAATTPAVSDEATQIRAASERLEKTLHGNVELRVELERRIQDERAARDKFDTVRACRTGDIVGALKELDDAGERTEAILDSVIGNYGDDMDKAVAHRMEAALADAREQERLDLSGANGAAAERSAASTYALKEREARREFRKDTASARANLRHDLALAVPQRAKGPLKVCTFPQETNTASAMGTSPAAGREPPKAKSEERKPGTAYLVTPGPKMTPIRGQNEKPQGLDACLVGTWRSSSISTLAGETGGAGIVMTIAADGSTSIDYGGMQKLTGSLGTTNIIQGKASGRITASGGTGEIVSVTSSDLTHSVTDPTGKTRTNDIGKTLGYGAIGLDPRSGSYSCSKDTLIVKNTAFTVTYARQKP